jgi:AmiR/NasT family two-component response regulator
MQPPSPPALGFGDELAAVHARLSGVLLPEQRWPTWSRQAVAVGMRSVLSAPLEAGVSNVHAARSAERIGDRLTETFRVREVIATATGIVMARKNVDSDRAYRHLVSPARSARIPLRQLAARMVAAPLRTSRT